MANYKTDKIKTVFDQKIQYKTVILVKMRNEIFSNNKTKIDDKADFFFIINQPLRQNY